MEEFTNIIMEKGYYDLVVEKKSDFDIIEFDDLCCVLRAGGLL